ncbi:hypothetical protein [Serinibacter arcticus]|uniref:Uncharacterized protein n=1 Tax=Serinibacter arcticus TaxID=1655435 RepID=A0A4Z1E4A4_9MICO|nr:hypothetical protein [Serinibacter arcticus]TGO06009.1 hypothetical protein SERN_0201 [Serinibacter arcticus]
MTARTRGWIIGLAVLNGLLVIGLVVTLMLGAANDGDDATAAESGSGSGEPAPALDGATSAPPSASESASAETAETPELAPPPEGALDAPAFALPSRNIACTLDEAAVTCTIADATFTPPAGEDCEFRGQVVTLSADGVAMPCPDGQQAPAGDDVPTLEYGQSTTVGSWACTSTESGVECSSLADGTRFTLARASFTSEGAGALG